MHPRLPVEREGWLYTAGISGLADVCGDAAVIVWPDEVRAGAHGPRVAALGVHAELGPQGTLWAVMTVLAEQARPPRAPLLAELVAAIQRRYISPPESVLADYLPRCTTIGRAVRARLIPMGPSGPQVTGEAVDCLADGALVILDRQGQPSGGAPPASRCLEDADAG